MSTPPTFIDEEREGITIVYSMNPWLIDPHLADTLSRHLCDLLEAGSDRLLVNLNQVSRLSSVFIRSFISAGKKAKEKDARISFCNISPVIREVFSLTGLDQLHRIYTTEQEALSDAAR